MQINIQDDDRTIEATFLVEASYPGISTNSKLTKFIEICESFNAVAILQKIEFKLKTVGVYGLYVYDFKGKDNRKWEQELQFIEDTDVDPKMSFDTKGDKWKLSEFLLHRVVRDELVYLHSHCSLQQFKIVWN